MCRLILSLLLVLNVCSAFASFQERYHDIDPETAGFTVLLRTKSLTISSDKQIKEAIVSELKVKGSNGKEVPIAVDSKVVNGDLKTELFGVWHIRSEMPFGLRLAMTNSQVKRLKAYLRSYKPESAKKPAPAIKVVQHDTVPTPVPTKLMLKPGPEEDSSDVLRDVLSLGGSFADYEIELSASPIELTAVAVSVPPTIGFFSEPKADTSAVPGAVERKDVPQDASASASRSVLHALWDYFKGKLAVDDNARYKLLISMQGDDVGYTDATQHTWGILRINTILLDTKSKRVVWFTKRAWGLGANLKSATDYGAKNLTDRLGEALGLRKPL